MCAQTHKLFTERKAIKIDKVDSHLPNQISLHTFVYYIKT